MLHALLQARTGADIIKGSSSMFQKTKGLWWQYGIRTRIPTTVFQLYKKFARHARLQISLGGTVCKLGQRHSSNQGIIIGVNGYL